ncbi:MAG: flagellar motor protein MotB [Bacteroidales bacterium]|nr:MAG: flagellar motor protein MotB [Bacteroidales bacterium]
MKKPFYFLALSSIILGSIFTSCGPSKDLIASRANADKLQEENRSTMNQLNDCQLNVKNLNAEKTTLKNENAMIENDLKVLSANSKMTIAEQASRLKNLNNLIKTQNDVMAKLMKSIVDALMNYTTEELSVYIKDGNVYVSLQEKLLFKSGSDAIDPKGKEALKTLANVIKNTKDINVVIEGHTDNVAIKTKEYEDNWDLSTARATSIVRLLTNDYGFDSNRITASGKGQFHPVKTNDTAEGRAANRRIEVILSPDLKELFSLMYL